MFTRPSSATGQIQKRCVVVDGVPEQVGGNDRAEELIVRKRWWFGRARAWLIAAGNEPRGGSVNALDDVIIGSERTPWPNTSPSISVLTDATLVRHLLNAPLITKRSSSAIKRSAAEESGGSFQSVCVENLLSDPKTNRSRSDSGNASESGIAQLIANDGAGRHAGRRVMEVPELI